MQAADYPEIPDDFGHWLAGFIDGEGSFSMLLAPRRPTPRFSLALRDDDLPILRQIMAETRIGHLDYIKPSANIRPKAVWTASSLSDCQRLVALLDRYPLRAKKARDYAVWRQAVLLWPGIRRGGAGRRNDWTPLEQLRQQLVDARSYEPPPQRESPGPPALWED